MVSEDADVVMEGAKSMVGRMSTEQRAALHAAIQKMGT